MTAPSGRQSPTTTIATIGATSGVAVEYRGTRRAVTFHNPTKKSTVYIVSDDQTAEVGKGIKLDPGASFTIEGNDVIRVMSGFNAVATEVDTTLIALEFT